MLFSEFYEAYHSVVKGSIEPVLIGMSIKDFEGMKFKCLPMTIDGKVYMDPAIMGAKSMRIFAATAIPLRDMREGELRLWLPKARLVEIAV